MTGGYHGLQRTSSLLGDPFSRRARKSLRRSDKMAAGRMNRVTDRPTVTALHPWQARGTVMESETE